MDERKGWTVRAMWAEIARYIQHVTGGDVTREPLQVFANIAQILSIVTLPAAIIGLLIALTSLREDRQGRRRIRDDRQKALWTALRLDVGSIQEIANADLRRFAEPDEVTPHEKPRNPEHPFVWTPLSADTVSQAIYEAGLLRLNEGDIEILQGFRNQIVGVNANIHAYFAVTYGGAVGGDYGVPRLTRIHNDKIKEQFENLVTTCQNANARFRTRWG